MQHSNQSSQLAGQERGWMGSPEGVQYTLRLRCRDTVSDAVPSMVCRADWHSAHMQSCMRSSGAIC